MIIPGTQVWPLIEEQDDPYAGDELLDDPADRPGDDDFRRLYREAVLGRLRLDDARLWRFAREQGLDAARARTGALLPEGIALDGIALNASTALGWDPSRDASPLLLPDLVLADIAEDRVPDLGTVAPGRVLGPRADEALSFEERLVAAGVMAFAIFIAPWVRPVDRFYKDDSEEDALVRASVHAVDRAPACLWSVQDGIFEPLLPLPPTLCPTGAARRAPLREGEPPRPVDNGFWLARLVSGPDGAPFASLALRLPRGADPDLLLTRLRLELWRERRHAPTLTWTDLLRHRGELVYRFAHELSWADA